MSLNSITILSCSSTRALTCWKYSSCRISISSDFFPILTAQSVHFWCNRVAQSTFHASFLLSYSFTQFSIRSSAVLEWKHNFDMLPVFSTDRFQSRRACTCGTTREQSWTVGLHARIVSIDVLET